MAIPDFVTGGILPTGIHCCDLAEIASVFVYNSRRQAIWSGFLSYLSQIVSIPEVDVIYVDGSFVTDRILPNDADIVLEFASVPILEKVASVSPQLFDRNLVKKTYVLDLLFTIEPIPAGVPDLRKFFQYLRPEEAIDRGVPVGTTKGILRISLNHERRQRTI